MWAVTQVTYSRPEKIQQKPDLSHAVQFADTFQRNTDLGSSCLCVHFEWIIIVYLTGSLWPILFCLKLQNNTQAHLRVLWAWMSFASGTESSAQESGCSPSTIFVRVALFETFTVLLHSTAWR